MEAHQVVSTAPNGATLSSKHLTVSGMLAEIAYRQQLGHRNIVYTGITLDNQRYMHACEQREGIVTAAPAQQGMQRKGGHRR